MLNRHGLITGATGTGKTITLKTMAESLSDLGIPTFLADIKGDVSGLGISGVANDNINERIERFKLEGFEFKSAPVTFWDIYGDAGIPIRTTVSEMGPLMLARLMDLSEAQSGVLSVIFKVADDQGLLLIDIKDLKALLDYCYRNNKELEREYGLLSTTTISAIIRKIVVLEEAGGNIFFGEPAFEFKDWYHPDKAIIDGKGMVNILHAVKLFHSPALYATFLLWMLSDLFENLEEVGDLDKPKMVFFFDEAHLLFNNMPKALVEHIELVVKLIRSKGVGVFFITQNPMDIPNGVLAQLGNRIQHALRAYTPYEQKAVRAAASSFRTNGKFNTEDVITELGTGEALISVLDIKGVPTIVERAFVLPCQCSFAEIDESTRNLLISKNPLFDKYSDNFDRESAYEIISLQREGAEREAEVLALNQAKEKAVKAPEKSTKKSSLEKGVDSALSTIGREFGKSITPLNFRPYYRKKID